MTTPRYLIPAGTDCDIQKLADPIVRWEKYVTKKELHFEYYEFLGMYAWCRFGEYTNVYEFRHEGYLVRVRLQDVVLSGQVARR